MRRMICVTLVLASAGTFATAGESSTRFWTDNTGEFTVKARVDRVDRISVTLELESGDIVRVPLRRLSGDDRAWLEKQNLLVELKSETISGIKWFPDIDDAKTVASETNRPIMCFRALGELSGFM